ncbi:hypothetical protein RF11_08443 [Thelohanellus kitauei]|uniref:Reverse transcriptase domain-containing protein n=1 Tax=Thelohanellus kitauei TaxID=669202 RepID=A0A0C2MKN5_THEKT|nr:hypothetical protein RF11_08443 [Thelohanellus kitauei]
MNQLSVRVLHQFLHLYVNLGLSLTQSKCAAVSTHLPSGVPIEWSLSLVDSNGYKYFGLIEGLCDMQALPKKVLEKTLTGVNSVLDSELSWRNMRSAICAVVQGAFHYYFSYLILNESGSSSQAWDPGERSSRPGGAGFGLLSNRGCVTL